MIKANNALSHIIIFKFYQKEVDPEPEIKQSRFVVIMFGLFSVSTLITDHLI